jgi:hypothetical protein
MLPYLLAEIARAGVRRRAYCADRERTRGMRLIDGRKTTIGFKAAPIMAPIGPPTANPVAPPTIFPQMPNVILSQLRPAAI